MKHLDLFAGIGGFSLALQRVIGLTEGGFSEIDKYATQIYKKHFPRHTEYGDITAIRERELPKFDLITFGFPCQDLSIAGKRKGFDGHRSSLFHEAIRIINEVRPKYFVFENVKGLYSSRKGEDFITVLQTITDIGYSGQWQLLNTKWFLPQNRERIYFVGHLRGESRPKVFPIGESDFWNNEPQREAQTEGERIRCGYPSLRVGGGNCKALVAQAIAQRDYKGGNNLVQVATIGKDSEATRVYDTDGLARTIKNAGGLGAKTGLYAVKGDLTSRNNPQRQNGFDDENMFCLRGAVQHNIMDDKNIRRLTPTECERLQGFPDGWTEGVSDTQRYKTLGNSITVNVAEEIFRKLFNN